MTDEKPVEHTRLWNLAKQAEDLSRQRAEGQMRLTKLKADYEETRRQTLTSLTRTEEKLAEVSRYLMQEAEGLRSTFGVSTDAPGHKGKPKLSRAGADKAFGAVIWHGTWMNRTVSLRGSWIAWLKSQPTVTVADFARWYGEQGGNAKSASPIFFAMKVWAREHSWQVTDNPTTLHRPAELELATATPEDKERMIMEMREREEVLR